MEMVPAMELALTASFGSVAQWRSAFLALHARHANRPGRPVLAFSPSDGRLINEWHDDAAPGGAVILLALDEEASGLARVDWAAVYERYQRAVEAASESFGASHEDVAGAWILDVRRRAMFEQAETRLPGAEWRDPASVAAWSADIPDGREVVVYCIYGHEVGRATALRLRAAGVPARYLKGGIDGWQAAGRPVEPKEGGA